MADVYLLGGNDLEMQTIRDLLQTHGALFVDRGLKWGATIGPYREIIADLVQRGDTPVCVELGQSDTLPKELLDRCVIVDHHNQYAGVRPSSLRQVFERLGCPEQAWSRRLQLVAANDEGWIPALQYAGASNDEVRSIRAEERRVLGIPLSFDRLPETFRTTCAGRLAEVLIEHEHTSAVNDWLHPSHGGPGAENSFIQTPTKLLFSGRGQIVQELFNRFGGWQGGRLPERGFWGCECKNLPATNEVLLIIHRLLGQEAT